MNKNTRIGIQGGFTLVELMIVVAVVAILLAVALPAYQDQVRKTKRSDGKGFLMEIAAAQERFFTQNVQYGTLAQLGYANNQSPEGYYTVGVALTNGNRSFDLTATPRAPFTDSECGNLTLDETNMRGSSAGVAADCWD